MSGLAAMSTATLLRKENLHASLSDPVLDTMNFLNEITFRYPKAISFAPGRPYDGFFDTEQIFTHIRRYLDHLAEHGTSPEEIRALMFQYGPTASYGVAVPGAPMAVGAGTAAVGVSARIKLTPGTTIHYRLTATKAGRTISTADATFTTPR